LVGLWKPKETYRAIVVILDGVGDRPVPELGGKTPLQVARKPNIDYVAKTGVTGLMDPIEPGVRPGTDTGHIAIFGYDPYKYYPGRGPLEAAGIGVELNPGDVALRCNIATAKEVNGKLVIIDRRAGRIRGEHVRELVRALNKAIKEIDGVRVEFYPATEHRVVLVLRGTGLSPRVSDSDPGTAQEGQPIREVRPLDKSEEARRTASIINKIVSLSYIILKDHSVNVERIKKGLLPGNVIITRGAGMVPKDLVRFSKRFGIRGYVIAEEATVVGAGRILGLEGEIPKGATANLDTDMCSILKSALRAYERGYDIVFTHIKGPDIAGHDANPRGKVYIIEKADWLVGELIGSIGLSENIITITADHTTPCTVRDHSGDPVPVAIAGPGVRRDDVASYDEICCMKGGLGRILGKQLIRIILDLMNKPLKWGA